MSINYSEFNKFGTGFDFIFYEDNNSYRNRNYLKYKHEKECNKKERFEDYYLGGDEKLLKT